MSMVAAILLAYLLGSISGSLLLGRFRGVDIRNQGSGNAGGTNALRTQGLRFALGVVIIDIGKGVLAAAVIPALPWFTNLEQSDQIFAAACGFAAVIGHCYPLWHGFRGGKGAGTLIGVLLVLAPLYLIPVLLVWVISLVLTGFVGLSTVLAVVSMVPISVLISTSTPGLKWLAIAAAILLVFTHRENIRRMINGTESRFEKARIQNWFN